MKVITLDDLRKMDRVIKCPKGNFVSSRFLIESDNMGFSLTRTLIPEGTIATWHYKNHLEACYCVSGFAILRNEETGDIFEISPGTMYALDNNEIHTFMATEETVLICVFNPPLKGREIHGPDNSY